MIKGREAKREWVRMRGSRRRRARRRTPRLASPAAARRARRRAHRRAASRRAASSLRVSSSASGCSCLSPRRLSPRLSSPTLCLSPPPLADSRREEEEEEEEDDDEKDEKDEKEEKEEKKEDEEESCFALAAASYLTREHDRLPPRTPLSARLPPVDSRLAVRPATKESEVVGGRRSCARIVETGGGRTRARWITSPSAGAASRQKRVTAQSFSVNAATRRLLRKMRAKLASLKPRKAAVVRCWSADLQRESLIVRAHTVSNMSSYSQSPLKSERREAIKSEFPKIKQVPFKRRFGTFLFLNVSAFQPSHSNHGEN